MDMQVQLEWETRIGPGMDRNWAHSICEKEREERDEQTSPQKSTEREKGALSS
jgi:hypothetical protein